MARWFWLAPFVLGAVCGDPGIGAAEPRPVRDIAALEAKLVEAANRARAEHGLVPLLVAPELTAVARSHSEAMARLGFYGHRGRDGSLPEDRLRDNRIPWRRVAENVQVNRKAKNPVASAIRSWLASPRNRENLLDPEFRSTGVGAAVDEHGAVFFTQLYRLP